MTKIERDFDAEFGQQCVRIGGRSPGVLTVAGPELTIEVGGTVFPFEWHSYCGPTPLNKRGEPRELPTKSPFWRAITAWIDQGKRLDENRKAIWEEPKPEDRSGYVRVGKNLFPNEMHERLSRRVGK